MSFVVVVVWLKIEILIVIYRMNYSTESIKDQIDLKTP